MEHEETVDRFHLLYQLENNPGQFMIHFVLERNNTQNRAEEFLDSGIPHKTMKNPY